MAKFIWKGALVSKRVGAASAAAINETLAECVAEAKNHHPGWKNITATAEGSVRVIEPASGAMLGARIVGKWGSVGVDYMLFLEYLHGHALTQAAETQYPSLETRIGRRLR